MFCIGDFRPTHSSRSARPHVKLTAISTSASAIWHQSTCITHEKSVFYEQVTGVKGLFLLFFHSAFAFVVALDFVALHRVSIRTLDELSWSKLGAGWGSRGESMLLFIGRSQKTKTRTQSSEYGVVATGKQDHL